MLITARINPRVLAVSTLVEQQTIFAKKNGLNYIVTNVKCYYISLYGSGATLKKLFDFLVI